MNEHILLSTEGSDRGTAYNISGKIIRRGHRLFVGWLDAARGLHHLAIENLVRS